MDEIRQAFADKNFDEKSLQFISNFIQEFDDLFGKIVPKDEVIRRIKENLDAIVYDLKSKNTRGEYHGIKKVISFRNGLDEESFKEVFFHEMIHCITRNQEKNVTGFSKIWETTDLDEVKMVTCHGLTEGFTQFVTEIRNSKYAPNLEKSSYPILSEQVRNIAQLIGESEFLDIGFNRPDDLAQELGLIDEYGWDIDANVFYDAFDTIWKEENEIYWSKPSNQSKEERLMRAIFGDVYNESRKLKAAKQTIINTLTKTMLKNPITNVEDFNQAYYRICKYARQLNTPIDFPLFEDLLLHIKNLQQPGKDFQEIFEQLPEDIQVLLEAKGILQDFSKLSKEKIIELLAQDSFYASISNIAESPFKETFYIKMSQSLMMTDSNERAYELFKQLINGFAEIINDRGYNVDTLSLEYIEFEELYGTTVFNLYNNQTGGSTYLGTFIDAYGDFLELTPYNKERENLIAKYPELADSVILSSIQGPILAYNGGGDYILIKWGDMYENNRIIYCQSELELIQEKLKQRTERLERFKKMNAPEFLLERDIEGIKLAIQMINEIQNKSKILPEEIEEATGDITQEEIDAIMANMTNSNEKRQEALERGIGYGEK